MNMQLPQVTKFQQQLFKTKRNFLILLSLTLILYVTQNLDSIQICVFCGSISLACLVTIVLNEGKIRKSLYLIISILLYEQSNHTTNKQIWNLFLFAWIYTINKLSTNIYCRVLILIHVIVSIVIRYILYENYEEMNSLIVIWGLFILILQLSLFTLKKKSKIERKVHTQIKSQVINQTSSPDQTNQLRDAYKQLTSRRSVKFNCDFYILDFLPIGVLLLNKNQEVQFMNDRARIHLQNLTNREITEEIAIETINNILKDGQTMQMVSPYQGRSQVNKLSRIISSMRIIEESEGIQIPQQSFISNFNNKEKASQSVQDNKNIIQYQHNGKKRFVKFQFYNQDGANLIIIMIIDITKKIEQQSQQQRFNFQHQLLNSFSHELRTPINCTQQILESLQMKLHYDIVENYIQPIIHQNDLLLCQINDILDYAALEVKNFQPNCRQFDLFKLLKRCQNIFNSACQQKQIQFYLNVKNVKIIKNDDQRIKQVLTNLLNNAIKFTDQGGEIKLKAKIIDQLGGRLIKIQVKDTGMGMNRQQLFELQRLMANPDEYRNDQNNSHIGLGLKVASKLAEGFNKQNTSLIIRSVQEKGTTVSFFVEDFDETLLDNDSDLNLQQLSRQYTSMQSAEFKFMKSINCQCKKILLVDDVPFNHTAMQLLFQELNYSSDSAFDGEQALKIVIDRANKNQCHPYYQLILMDIEMPRMNGFDSSKLIKEYLKENSNQTAIVMCSAYDNLECRKLGKKYLMDNYLPKPISKHRLLEILQEYLK